MSGTAAGAEKARVRLRLKREAGLVIDTSPRMGRKPITAAAKRMAWEAVQERLALEAAAKRERLAPQRRQQAEMDRQAARRIYGAPRRLEPLPPEEHRCRDGDCLVCRIRL